jgi:hypothetical protein
VVGEAKKRDETGEDDEAEEEAEEMADAAAASAARAKKPNGKAAQKGGLSWKRSSSCSSSVLHAPTWCQGWFCQSVLAPNCTVQRMLPNIGVAQPALP